MPSPTSLSDIRAEALARRDQGDLNSARSLLERALEAATLSVGDDHPEVLITGHLLAGLNRQAGDLSGARRVLENGLYAGTPTHGEEHPLLLAMSFDLAEIADELGNRHEARRHYTRIARYGPQVPGFDPQQIQVARAWLGPSAPAPAPATAQSVTLPAVTRLTTATPAVPATPVSPMPPVHAEPPAHPEPPPHPRTPAQHQPPEPAHPAAHPALSEHTRQMPALPAPQPAEWQPAPHPAPTRFPTPPARPHATILPPPVVFQPTAVTAPAEPRRSRGPVLAAFAAAFVAVVAAGVAVTLALMPKQDSGPEIPAGPTATGPATDLQVSEVNGDFTLTWRDPSRGIAAQILLAGRPGEQLKILQYPGNGDTEIVVRGLNRTWDYCFVIASVYSQKDIRQSEQVCTNRIKSPAPSR